MVVDQRDMERIFEQLESLKKMIVETEKPFFSMDEASAYMGLPKNTLYQYTSRNLLPYYKTGKRAYF